MKTFIDKRQILCDFTEIYLNTKGDSYISINDGIMNSHDFDSISFLMFLALVYSNQEVISVYSMDITESDEERMQFVDKEYNKIIHLKKDKVLLGKIILDDAKSYYQEQYGKNGNENIEEKSHNHFL